MKMETQGERIKRLRENAGLTLEEVGKKIGLTKQAIYKYENDIVTNIPYERILLLAKAFDVEPWEVLGWDPPTTKPFKADDLTITIPFVSQKLSAGRGENYLSDDDIEVRTISVSAYLARGIDKATLLAAEVRGDSMIDEKIFSGDIVVFSRGLIRQEGIYVINYAGDLMVKKLSFDALNNRVDIISGNRNYPTRTVDAELIEILGKVVGWIHRLDF